MRNGGEAILVIAGILFLAVVAWISKQTGADFLVVAEAVGKSFLPILAAGVALYFGYARFPVCASVSLIFIYPCWWPVIDSIAQNAGLMAPSTWGSANVPWWTTGWFHAFIECLLIGHAGYWAISDR